MSLALARMHALALAHHHSWAQKFDHYSPPTTLDEALAAHKEAQDADPDHTIVVPSLTHTTGSGRTSWQIAEDGTVTATICEITPGGDEWGDYTLTERAHLTIAPDGAHVLTQMEGCDLSDLDRVCRVWRAVCNIIQRPGADRRRHARDRSSFSGRRWDVMNLIQAEQLLRDVPIYGDPYAIDLYSVPDNLMGELPALYPLLGVESWRELVPASVQDTDVGHALDVGRTGVGMNAEVMFVVNAMRRTQAGVKMRLLLHLRAKLARAVGPLTCVVAIHDTGRMWREVLWREPGEIWDLPGFWEVVPFSWREAAVARMSTNRIITDDELRGAPSAPLKCFMSPEPVRYGDKSDDIRFTTRLIEGEFKIDSQTGRLGEQGVKEWAQNTAQQRGHGTRGINYILR